MEPFIRHQGKVAPLDRANVDTDQIIPKQFLKRIERTGYGAFLFHDWRADPGFVLNQPRYQGASILLARANFGCGSSREHAPWALGDFGFRAILAPSFADIFYGNCFQNGLLPVRLREEEIDELFRRTASREGYTLTVDLDARTVRDDHGFSASFAIEPHRREAMMDGLDDIGRTLAHAAAITAYEERHR